jgi:hypothetical protein
MHTSRLAPTTLTTEDAITVIAYETESISQISETADVPAEYSADMAEEVLECIEEILEEHHPTVRIIPPDKFLEVAFPNLTPEDSPPVILSWEHMARDPGFQARIAPLGLRYLITVFGLCWTGPRGVPPTASIHRRVEYLGLDERQGRGLNARS